MNFSASDKVVCISDRFDPIARSLASAIPEKGRVYVVREVVNTADIPRKWRRGLTGQGLRLVGIIAAIHPCGMECCWRSANFRKLADVQAENAIAAELTLGKT